MRLIIVGFGNLGRALVRVLSEKKEFLGKRYGLSPKVSAVVDEYGALVKEEGFSFRELAELAEKGRVVGGKKMSGEEVVREVEGEVVFELTPTNIETGEPGLTHIKEAMLSGKHVVTSNKGPLVVAFRELEELSKKKSVEFRYSASVGGAIPVISLARKVLTGNRILAIRGVLNGTTNYILTRMSQEDVPLDIVLREAQELGIAEKDPSLDLEGVDTACKITILANAVLGRNAKLKEVKREGIMRVTPQVMRLAQEAGFTVKLVGTASENTLEVAPRLVPIHHPLAVSGTLNAVSLELDLAREITITGFGAGPQETSSSLLGDLVDIHQTLLGK
ncbi:MAG: homoserine dehydrogenase [Candidatus Hadarchaeales archaeon]